MPIPTPRHFATLFFNGSPRGLEDAGHTNEVVDLYAIGFDPVLRLRDNPNWIDESVPMDMLEEMNLKQRVLDSSGGPLQRLIMKRWLQQEPFRHCKANQEE